MRAIRIVLRSFRDAFKSVFRNFSLSMASILCATITLLVVSIGLIIAGNVNNTTELLKSELNIVVYLDKDATDEDMTNLETILKNNKKVKNVELKSKELWKKEISASNSTYETIFKYYEENPLLNTLVVTLKDVKDLDSVTNEIKGMDKVSDANYFEDTVKNIIPIFDVVEKSALILVVALIFVTAFLITNTIKLTIYSRREEIEIMRLVGASNMAIKLPFVIEGFVIGVLGSILPIIISIYGYIILFSKTNGNIITGVIPLLNPYYFIFYVSGMVLVLGAIIGMAGSLKAVRKYLKI